MLPKQSKADKKGTDMMKIKNAMGSFLMEQYKKKKAMESKQS